MMPSKEKRLEFLKQVGDLVKVLLDGDHGELIWVSLTYPDIQIDIDKDGVS